MESDKLAVSGQTKRILLFKNGLSIRQMSDTLHLQFESVGGKTSTFSGGTLTVRSYT